MQLEELIPVPPASLLVWNPTFPCALLLLSGLGFNAPLCLIMLTYFLMHLASSFIRACSRRQGGGSEEEKQVLLQTLSRSQWFWKVFPVAAASGLEVCRLVSIVVLVILAVIVALYWTFFESVKVAYWAYFRAQRA